MMRLFLKAPLQGAVEQLAAKHTRNTSGNPFSSEQVYWVLLKAPATHEPPKVGTENPIYIVSRVGFEPG